MMARHILNDVEYVCQQSFRQMRKVLPYDERSSCVMDASGFGDGHRTICWLKPLADVRPVQTWIVNSEYGRSYYDYGRMVGQANSIGEYFWKSVAIILGHDING